jgi:Abnormal spindle-like microcephaly-assoc'd, ASPM-SPD-2-Hydin
LLGTLIVLGLICLTGCQGVSAGGSTQPIGNLVLGVQSLDFGSVSVGSNESLTVTATNSGDASITISSASISTPYFAFTSPRLPAAISAGESATFTVEFTPNAAGTFNAVLAITSNASDSSVSLSLSGTGTAASTHTVNLSWNASSSPNVVGYNIYRAMYTTSCGSYSKINSLLDTATLYTDSAVVDGTSYCYASTAVNTSNEESAYSNIVSNVKIPAP